MKTNFLTGIFHFHRIKHLVSPKPFFLSYQLITSNVTTFSWSGTCNKSAIITGSHFVQTQSLQREAAVITESYTPLEKSASFHFDSYLDL